MADYPEKLMAIQDVKDHFSAVVEQVVSNRERVVITRRGKPAAMLISVDELEGLEETLDVLSDPEETKALLEAMAQDRRGEVVRMTKEEFLADLKSRRQK